MTLLEIGLLCFTCFVVGLFTGGYCYCLAIGVELESGIAKCGSRIYKATRLEI